MLKNKEMTLLEIQQVEFELLKYFDAFCKEHSIQYCLSNGSLLGAVKYKGFIPWDDDIDLFVPRSDYNRLLKEFTDTEKYRLFSPERESKYRFPFAKLCDMETSKDETNNNNGVSMGLDIDIFPLDDWDGDYQVAKEQAARQKKRMMLLGFSKNKRITSPNVFKIIPKKIIAYFCRKRGFSAFIKDILSEVKDDIEDVRYKGCLIWPVYGEREVISAEVFSKTIDVEFMGEYFPAPIGYDIYLKSLYGDYHKDPPIEKQKTHHVFKAYWL